MSTWAGTRPVLETVAGMVGKEEREILMHLCGVVANAVAFVGSNSSARGTGSDDVGIAAANGRCFVGHGGGKA